MEKKFIWFILVAIVSFVFVLGTYIAHFNNGFSISKSDWGTFGDYIGGTLNPILSFLSLIAILYTVNQQNYALEISLEELENTREELKHTREISERQVEHFEFQAKKEDLIRVIELAKSNIRPPQNGKESYFDSDTKRFYNSLKILYLYLLSYDELVGKNNSVTDFYKSLYFAAFDTLERCRFDYPEFNPQADEFKIMKNYFESGSKNFNLLDTDDLFL